jgi:hypothetical protein
LNMVQDPMMVLRGWSGLRVAGNPHKPLAWLDWLYGLTASRAGRFLWA